jgi:NTE family protein
MAQLRHKKPRVGLVLGAGGAKCAASLGLWKVLQRAGIQVDLAVGCSGGSLYATAIALGWTREQAEDYTRMWEGAFARINYGGLLRALFPRVFGASERFGLVDDRRINRALQAVYGDRTFKDTRIPLYIVATDFKNGRAVVISEGSLFDAVRASIAVPIIIAPWLVNDRLLIDGGASDPLPISVAIREGCETILAMGFEAPHYPRVDSLANYIDQTSHIVTNNLIRSTFAFYNLAHHAEVVWYCRSLIAPSSSRTAT